MVDEREGEVSPEDLPYAFTQKPPWQRIAIALAGPLANLILAVLLYWLLATVQGSFSVSPVIGDVEQGSIAEFARLESGQEIVAVDGHSTPTRRALELLFDFSLGGDWRDHLYGEIPRRGIGIRVSGYPRQLVAQC